MALMTEKRMRHLPVVEDTKVIGIVSIGDMLKFIF
jgi:CBS domain-containing protein